MFPWQVGTFGGTAFLIPYLIFLILIGWVGLTIEWGLGRSQDGGPQIAFEKAGFPAGKWLGAAPLIVAVLAMGLYCNIIGWSLKFLVGTLTGDLFAHEAGVYYDTIAFKPEARLWFVFTVAVTVSIVAGGVRRGIEFAAKLMMPLLLVLIVVMAAWAVTLPGAAAGIRFYLLPDLSKLTPELWLMALGQSFFSMSIGGGAMIVYGSYLRKTDDIVAGAVAVALGNTLVSLLAGLAIFPAVFAFGLSPASGPELAFVSIPLLLKSMPYGGFFGGMFFLCLFLAGITSSIGILQVTCDALVDRFNWRRQSVAVGAGAVCIAVGWFASTDPGYFQWLVTTVTVWALLLLALLSCLVFLWRMDANKAREHINTGARFPVGSWWLPLAKYVYPAIIIFVLVVGIGWGFDG